MEKAPVYQRKCPGMDYLLFGNIQEWNNVKNPGEIKPKTTLKSTILAKFRVFKGSEKIPHFADFFSQQPDKMSTIFFAFLNATELDLFGENPFEKIFILKC